MLCPYDKKTVIYCNLANPTRHPELDSGSDAGVK
jgi:hypothetical protein